MSYFKQDPVEVLESKEDVLRAVQTPGWQQSKKGLDAYRIRSTWLIALIDRIAATGQYPYSSVVKKAAWLELGLPPLTEAEYHTEGDALSLLVYNAQCYRRHDQYVAEGYEPFTEATLERAGEGGKIQLYNEVVFKIIVNGKPADITPPTVLTVKRVNGRLYAMKPRVRKYAVSPIGQPAKIVKGK